MDFIAGEILYFNKPLTWTSFDLVNKFRYKLSRKLKVKKIKVGHAGTLDPLATGVMIVCTGRATKRIDEFQYQTTRLKSAKHEYHRDLFLFSCFTGICYKDMRYLTCEQIIPDTKGHLWIHGNRCKTGGEYMVKFLPAALRLLEKYRGTAPLPLAFDMPKLSSINCSLRRITKQCGISRHITFHCARHSVFSFSLKFKHLQNISA